DLEIDGLETVVDVSVNDAGRTGDAFPRSQHCFDPIAGFVLEERREMSAQNEEDLLDFVRVRGVALAGFNIHDAQREAPRRDHIRISMLAGSAGADETVLSSTIPLLLGVFERIPVGLAIAEP